MSLVKLSSILPIHYNIQTSLKYLQGVPGNGNFTRKEDLYLALTSIIYTCSVAHASTNFPQYDEYAFPPNYPALLNGEPPNDKVNLLLCTIVFIFIKALIYRILKSSRCITQISSTVASKVLCSFI